MLLWMLSHLLNKVANKDRSLWVDTYQIGLLQGKLGLLESTIDPELIDKHHREKSGEATRKRWDKHREIQKQEMEPILDKIDKMAEDGLRQGTMLHDELTNNIYNDLIRIYPGIEKRPHFDIDLVRGRVREKARKQGRLRGVPLLGFSGNVKKVDVMVRHVVVENKEGEKTVLVNETTKITKGIEEIPLTAIRRGMNVSVKYRVEMGRMVARTINVTGPVRLPQKKADKKPAKDPKK